MSGHFTEYDDRQAREYEVNVEKYAKRAYEAHARSLGRTAHWNALPSREVDAWKAAARVLLKPVVL